MSQTSPLPKEGIFHSGLLQIPKALRNEKALFALLSTNLLTLVPSFLGNASGSSSVANLLALLALFIILPAGVSVAGLLLMDQAQGLKPRPLGKAVSDAIPVFLRTLGIALLCIALMLGALLVLALLLFVCRLPAVGPVLYAMLFPILAIVGGLLQFSLMAGLSIACPAIWNGASLGEALETLRRIAAHRPVELLLNLFLLFALIFLAGLILGGIVFAGALPVLGISVSILDMDAFALVQTFSGQSSDSLLALRASSTSYAPAIIFGFKTGFMLCLATITAMAMIGANLIYLRITKDLPPPKARKYAPNAMPQGKGKLASQPASQAPIADSSPTTILAEAAPGATAKNTGYALICPRCQTPAQPCDIFCGECGSSLRN